MSTLFGLIAFAAFVCTFLGLIKPSLLSRFSKKPMTRLRSFATFGGIFFLFLILAAASSPSQPVSENQSESQNDASVMQEDAASYVTEENTQERTIEQAIIELLGEASNEDLPRVRNIDAYDGVILVEYSADENLTSNLTRFGIWMDTIEIVQKLSDNEDINSVTVNAYLNLVDAYGNTAPGKVMTVNITKETWSKINWDNFLTDNLPVVADIYWVHPAIND